MRNIFARSFFSILIPALTVFFLPASAFGTQIQWATKVSEPVLSVFLSDQGQQKEVTLSKGSQWVNLIVRKGMYGDDTLKLVWLTGGQVWLSKNKKLPAELSEEKMFVPPVKTWSLEIRTLEGKTLASIHFVSQ